MSFKFGSIDYGIFLLLYNMNLIYILITFILTSLFWSLIKVEINSNYFKMKRLLKDNNRLRARLSYYKGIADANKKETFKAQ